MIQGINILPTKKTALSTIAVFFTVLISFGQTGKIEGVITDDLTGETLIGTNVLIGEGIGTVTDIDGRFSIEAEYGSYTLKVSYIGYEPQERTIELNKARIVVNFKLKGLTLREVEVVADVARDRETPVAFSNISPTQIKEELASQDIPMLLNTTPGVYATQDGGGDGDARITIRGFSQRNVAVMMDGVPVNDMENGWVYWSNWFGLDVVTRSIQIQRGLSSSKIAVPSIGGTINILTKGSDAKKGGTIKQEVGTGGFLRTTIGLTTGRSNNGWAFSAAGSWKKGDGYVDQTWTEGWFAFMKVEKQLGKHLLSFSGFGAPQEHGQRSQKSYITTYSTDLAREVGISDTLDMDNINQGSQFNPHWGYLQRYTGPSGPVNDSTPVTNIKGIETLNDRQNFYFKPMFILRDGLSVSDKLYVSTIGYVSLGQGGGRRFSVTHPDRATDGTVDWQGYYDANAGFTPFGNIDPVYHPTLHKSSSIIYANRNNHNWVGLLSTANYKINDKWRFSGGLDLRTYKGIHYREVVDLFGGQYYVDDNEMRFEGDKITYHNDAIIRWAGAFGVLEYTTPVISTFLNVSGIYNWYKRVDYMNANPDGSASESEWHQRPGYTVKGGANYNLNEWHSVYTNLGYIKKPARFANVFDFSNQLFTAINDEEITAVELGYKYSRSKFAANINAYWTNWLNRPYNGGISVNDGEARANIRGMNARHTGVELDLAYNVSRKLTIEGLVSLGDWIWNSKDTVDLVDETGAPALGPDDNDFVAFDARGVHVGDAAQTQFGASLRYEPIKGLYFKLRGTHFSNHYAQFDPFTLSKGNEGRESWLTPSYAVMDFHAGYRFRFNTMSLNIRGSLLNVLDELYISDAQNNDTNLEPGTPANFDAASAGVFVGLGRRFNLSLQLNF